MPFRKRLTVLGIIGVVTLSCYGLARHYSPVMVIYVVEQALVQKAPQSIDPAAVRQRYRNLMAALPTQNDKLKQALILSQFLEKLQRLSQAQYEDLLGDTTRPLR